MFTTSSMSLVKPYVFPPPLPRSLGKKHATPRQPGAHGILTGAGSRLGPGDTDAGMEKVSQQRDHTRAPISRMRNREQTAALNAEPCQLDIGFQRHATRVALQNLLSSFLIRDTHLPIPLYGTKDTTRKGHARNYATEPQAQRSAHYPFEYLDALTEIKERWTSSATGTGWSERCTGATQRRKELRRRILGMAKLILKRQDTTLEEFPITKSPMTIGREQSNDIVLDNMMVSRHHVKIFQDHKGYWIEDLNSGNGLFVNQKKVTQDLLKDQDEVRVGKHTFVFVLEEIPSVETAQESTDDLMEKTFILPRNRRELMALLGEKKSDGETEGAELTGGITLISGGIRQAPIALTKPTTIAGKSDNVDIKLSGFWVGKHAFIISKEPDRFVLTPCGSTRRTRVNDEVVAGQQELHDGDVITIGSTKMRFSLTKQPGRQN
jgi:pSer/pThr/pTyr-binding forkhead associated (FHA) protein